MSSLNEAETRKKLIDPQLVKAGWGQSQRRIVEEYLIQDNCKEIKEDINKFGDAASEFADYVLLDRNLKPLSVVASKGKPLKALHCFVSRGVTLIAS